LARRAPIRGGIPRKVSGSKTSGGTTGKGITEQSKEYLIRIQPLGKKEKIFFLKGNHPREKKGDEKTLH